MCGGGGVCVCDSSSAVWFAVGSLRGFTKGHAAALVSPILSAGGGAMSCSQYTEFRLEQNTRHPSEAIHAVPCCTEQLGQTAKGRLMLPCGPNASYETANAQFLKDVYLGATFAWCAVQRQARMTVVVVALGLANNAAGKYIAALKGNNADAKHRCTGDWTCPKVKPLLSATIFCRACVLTSKKKQKTEP